MIQFVDMISVGHAGAVVRGPWWLLLLAGLCACRAPNPNYAGPMVAANDLDAGVTDARAPSMEADVMFVAPGTDGRMSPLVPGGTQDGPPAVPGMDGPNGPSMPPPDALAPPAAQDAQAPVGAQDAQAPVGAQDSQAPVGAQDSQAPVGPQDAGAMDVGTPDLAPPLPIVDLAPAAKLDAAPEPVPVRPASALGGAGWEHACVVRGGQVFCWGDNAQAQLGDGTETGRNDPVRATGLTNVIVLRVAENHNCALTSGGNVFCWGRNSDGQLGDGTGQTRLTPTPMTDLPAATDVWVGPRSSCVRKAGGDIWCTGLYSGLASDPRRLTSNWLVRLPGIENAIDVALADGAGCAVAPSGVVSCWGQNAEGQLGDGTTTTRHVPAPVKTLTDAVAVAAGLHHFCAVRRTGGVVCWGSNYQGRLGDGTTLERRTPVPVLAISDAIGVDASIGHTCAWERSGRLFCWGNNDESQFGTGTTSRPALSPLRAFGTTGAAAAWAGSVFTCVPSGSSVLCAGSNAAGALGDGTYVARPSPVAVRLPF